MDNLQVGTPYVNQDVISLHEAAIELKISYAALGSWLRNHPDFYKSNVFKQQYKGRLKYVIAKPSLVVLATMKNGSRNNQHSKMLADRSFSEEKQIVAQEHNQMAELLKDPIIAFRIDQLKMQKDIEAMRQELVQVKQLATQSPPEHITNPQREFLNERVRNYAIQTGIPFSFIWSKLHRSVQKSSVESYKFGDYKIAITCLKEMYAQSGIDWS